METSIFQTQFLRAASSVVCGRIWPNFKLIQALMYVIITCKYENDPIKNDREKSGYNVFQIITLSVAKETDEKDQMKNSGENVIDVIFSIKSLWDFFQTLKGSQLRSPWSDLAEFRTLMYIIVTCKFEMNLIKNI